MKNKLFLFVILLLLSSLAGLAKVKPDTIDNWQVYYNGKLVMKFNATSQTPTITIKKASVKPGDVLSISYFKDTPCSDCEVGIYIEDNFYKKIPLASGKGTFAVLKIPVSKIMVVLKLLNEQKADIYYFDDRGDRFIFQLVLQ